MKKKKFGRKLSRGWGARKALYRLLIGALAEHGSIVTTKAKAKSVQGSLDKLINIAKGEGVAGRRRVLSFLGNDRKSTDKIFSLAKTNFQKRKGGYTRIVNLPQRRGDSAEMVRLEWVEEVESIKGIKSTKSIKSRKKIEGKKSIKGSKSKSA